MKVKISEITGKKVLMSGNHKTVNAELSFWLMELQHEGNINLVFWRCLYKNGGLQGKLSTHRMYKNVASIWIN